MSLPEGGRENKRKKDHEDGHHCLVPLFFLFLICAMLVLQVSKVEKLHKVGGRVAFAEMIRVKCAELLSLRCSIRLRTLGNFISSRMGLSRSGRWGADTA